MTDTYSKLKGRKNKIEWAKSELNYENETTHSVDDFRVRDVDDGARGAGVLQSERGPVVEPRSAF